MIAINPSVVWLAAYFLSIVTTGVLYDSSSRTSSQSIDGSITLTFLSSLVIIDVIKIFISIFLLFIACRYPSHHPSVDERSRRNISTLPRDAQSSEQLPDDDESELADTLPLINKRSTNHLTNQSISQTIQLSNGKTVKEFGNRHHSYSMKQLFIQSFSSINRSDVRSLLLLSILYSLLNQSIYLLFNQTIDHSLWMVLKTQSIWLISFCIPHLPTNQSIKQYRWISIVLFSVGSGLIARSINQSSLPSVDTNSFVLSLVFTALVITATIYHWKLIHQPAKQHDINHSNVVLNVQNVLLFSISTVVNFSAYLLIPSSCAVNQLISQSIDYAVQQASLVALTSISSIFVMRYFNLLIKFFVGGLATAVMLFYQFLYQNLNLDADSSIRLGDLLFGICVISMAVYILHINHDLLFKPSTAHAQSITPLPNQAYKLGSIVTVLTGIVAATYLLAVNDLSSSTSISPLNFADVDSAFRRFTPIHHSVVQIAADQPISPTTNTLKSDARGYVAVIYSGQPRAFSSVFKSHLVNLFAPSPYTLHVFFHLNCDSQQSYNQFYDPTDQQIDLNKLDEVQSVHATLDYYSHYINLDGEKVSINQSIKSFELTDQSLDPSIAMPEFVHFYDVLANRSRSNPDSSIKQLFSLWRVNQARLKYESANHVEYQYIIRVRTDHILKSNIWTFAFEIQPRLCNHSSYVLTNRSVYEGMPPEQQHNRDVQFDAIDQVRARIRKNNPFDQTINQPLTVRVNQTWVGDGCSIYQLHDFVYINHLNRAGLAVPNCHQWLGYNDQFAIGGNDTINLYCDRLFNSELLAAKMKLKPYHMESFLKQTTDAAGVRVHQRPMCYGVIRYQPPVINSTYYSIKQHLSWTESSCGLQDSVRELGLECCQWHCAEITRWDINFRRFIHNTNLKYSVDTYVSSLPQWWNLSINQSNWYYYHAYHDISKTIGCDRRFWLNYLEPYSMIEFPFLVTDPAKYWRYQKYKTCNMPSDQMRPVNATEYG